MRTVLAPVLLLWMTALVALTPLLVAMRSDGQSERLALARRSVAVLATALEHASSNGQTLPPEATLARLARSYLPAGAPLALRLEGADQTLLWSYGTRLPAAATALHAAVGQHAVLRVVLAPMENTAAVQAAALLLLGALMALSLPVALLAALAARRNELAAVALARQCAAAQTGDLRVTWQSDGVGDTRMRYLREQVALLCERCQRVQRQLLSFERSEPDPAIRPQLHKLQRSLTQRFGFPSSGGPSRRMLWPGAEGVYLGASLLLLLTTAPLGRTAPASWQGLAWGAGALLAWPLLRSTRLGRSWLRLAWLAAAASVLLWLAPPALQSAALCAAGLASALGLAATLAVWRRTGGHGGAVAGPLLAACLLGPMLGRAIVTADVWHWGTLELMGGGTVMAVWGTLLPAMPRVPQAGGRLYRAAALAALAGLAWGWASLLFLDAGSAAQWLCALPGLVLLGTRVRRWLAPALALVLLAGWLAPEGYGAYVGWAGAACAAGALAMAPGALRAAPAQLIVAGAAGWMTALLAFGPMGLFSTPLARPALLLALAAAACVQRLPRQGGA